MNVQEAHEPNFTDRPPDEDDYRALADFRAILRRFLAVSDAAAHAAGLTSQRYQALLAIRVRAQGANISVGELADQLLVKPHSAAELVNRLEGAGLVRRASDASDRRRVLLHLTDEGERRLSELAQTQFRELETHREALLGLAQSLQKMSRQEPGS